MKPTGPRSRERGATRGGRRAGGREAGAQGSGSACPPAAPGDGFFLNKNTDLTRHGGAEARSANKNPSPSPGAFRRAGARGWDLLRGVFAQLGGGDGAGGRGPLRCHQHGLGRAGTEQGTPADLCPSHPPARGRLGAGFSSRPCQAGSLALLQLIHRAEKRREPRNGKHAVYTGAVPREPPVLRREHPALPGEGTHLPLPRAIYFCPCYSKETLSLALLLKSRALPAFSLSKELANYSFHRLGL